MTRALRTHWPEYLIEGWALGTFMVSAGLVATLLGAPASPVHRALPDPMWRNAVGGIAMGLGLSGVLLVAVLAGHAFSDPPVSYAATLPGPSGPAAAFAAEFAISAILMLTVLSLSAAARLASYTGLIVGGLVAAYITFESPLSGMSMNPARSLASAAPGMQWRHLWIYLTAPLLGMLSGAQLFLMVAGARRVLCAKLLHPLGVPCIHCGYQPSQAPRGERSPAQPGSARA